MTSDTPTAVAARAGGVGEEIGRPTRVLMLLAFFASGASAIVCQVAWQRILMTLGGVDAHSATTTIAAFMLGLGVGNLAGGALGDRLGASRCFIAYLLLETRFLRLQFGIPQYGLLGPLLLFAAARAFGLPSFGLRWAMAALVVVPPAFLMGVAYPVLQRVVIRDVETLGRHTGALLFANTAGAFAGTTLTGLVLLDVLGTPRTLAALAALALGFEIAT